MATILLVEDDGNQRLLYEQELGEEGYTVRSAASGPEALAMLEGGERPDVVVLDIYMPGMDGIEALGKILGTDNSIPVILNTAYATYKDNFMTWAADAYVIKSSDLAELKAKIKEILAAGGKVTEDRA